MMLKLDFELLLMQKYTYYPSTSKKFVIGPEWKAWNKFVIRKDRGFRALSKKETSLKQTNEKSQDFKKKLRKSSIEIIGYDRKIMKIQDHGYQEFSMFGGERLGLMVKPAVTCERKKSLTFRSTGWGFKPNTCGSVSEVRELRYRKGSI